MEKNEAGKSGDKDAKVEDKKEDKQESSDDSSEGDAPSAEAIKESLKQAEVSRVLPVIHTSLIVEHCRPKSRHGSR